MFKNKKGYFISAKKEIIFVKKINSVKNITIKLGQKFQNIN